MIGAQTAAGAEQEAQREVRRGLGDRAGAVRHVDPALRALHGVDVVEADGRGEHDAEVRRPVEELAIDVRVGEHHKGIRLRQPLRLDIVRLLRPPQPHVHTAGLELGNLALL